MSTRDRDCSRLQGAHLCDCGRFDNIPPEVVNFDLFVFFLENHGLTLVNSEIDDIIHAVEHRKSKP